MHELGCASSEFSVADCPVRASAMGRHCKWEEFFDEWASGTGVMTRFSRAERPSTTPV